MPIEISQVTYVYNPGTSLAARALDRVSLTFNEGKVYGIMGQSGSGKSTLLQIMNGLLLPQKGMVTVDGQRLSGLSSRELKKIRSKVGLVFQFPEKQFFETTVLKEVAFGPRNFGYRDEEILSMARKALELTGLSYEEFAHRRPWSLSSGEKRRLAIASILAFEPGYLLLDEPVAGMDYDGRNRLFETLKTLNRKNSTTVVMVSHRLSHLLSLCDEIVFMEQGKISLTAATEELLSMYPRLLEMNIQPPLYYQVVMELNKKGWNLPGAYTDMNVAAKDIAERLIRKES